MEARGHNVLTGEDVSLSPAVAVGAALYRFCV